MATRQRDISISEFFAKNRHLLGFDNPTRALLTCVKEAVDNALDACEEARIPPEVIVELHPAGENRIRVIVQDNGPGIVRAQIPRIFGRLLYGSKFHKMSQSRGQQGIGISAAGMYGLLTTGKPIEITSRTSPRKPAHHYHLAIDTAKNQPDILKEEGLKWAEVKHGTRVEIELEARYIGGERSVDNYIKQTAIANPHVRVSYLNRCKKEPDEKPVIYERVTEELPPEVQEIKPHPHGVELGMLLKMLKSTATRRLTSFLQEDFCRVGTKTAEQIVAQAGLSSKAHPKRIARNEADNLHKAIQETKISAPSTRCIAPIGEDLMLAGLKKEVEADFYTATTRPPSVYRGMPFQIEAALAYGKPGGIGLEVDEVGRIRKSQRAKNGESLVEIGAADEPIRLIRFANRVPLQFQRSACAITRTVISGVSWRNYAISQSRGALPTAPMVLMVHIASVWVPFTSESKDAVAGYDVIQKEIKLAIQECARKLAVHVRRGRRIKAEYQKREHIEQFIPHIGAALQDILKISKAQREETEETLKDTLERSRKI